jgi:hypothetical protein
VGFTPFHFFRFQKNSVTVALSEYFQHIQKDLADFSAVRDESLPTFTDGTNTPGISAPGEPGLSSTHVHMSRDYSPFHVCFVHHYENNYNIHSLKTALVKGFQIWKVFTPLLTQREKHTDFNKWVEVPVPVTPPA